MGGLTGFGECLGEKRASAFEDLSLLRTPDGLAFLYGLFADHYDGAGEAQWEAVHPWTADHGGGCPGVSGVGDDA